MSLLAGGEERAPTIIDGWPATVPGYGVRAGEGGVAVICPPGIQWFDHRDYHAAVIDETTGALSDLSPTPEDFPETGERIATERTVFWSPDGSWWVVEDPDLEILIGCGPSELLDEIADADSPVFGWFPPTPVQDRDGFADAVDVAHRYGLRLAGPEDMYEVVRLPRWRSVRGYLARDFPAFRRSLSFQTLKRLSFTHSAIYFTLLAVWLIPGLHGAEFVFGLAHGVGWIAMCILCIAALRARVISLPLTVAVTVIGGIGPFVGSYAFVREQGRREQGGRMQNP